jgi:U4/U6 small nuclear ribonucleoprotein PRP4
MILPTNDGLVKERLRELEEPAILFGEGPAERRERLKNELNKRELTQGMPRSALAAGGASGMNLDQAQHTTAQQASAEKTDRDEVVYTPGTKQLLASRRAIAQFSLLRANARVRAEKKHAASDDPDLIDATRARTRCEKLASFSNQSSEVGGERPLSSCALSPDGKELALTDWSGACSVWNVADSKQKRVLRVHTDRANHIIYHPTQRAPTSTTMQLASAAVDKRILLWSASSATPISTLDGHTDRVNRLAMHPDGKHLVSTSHDHMWRIWDVDTAQCLLEQEGHYNPVHAVAIQVATPPPPPPHAPASVHDQYSRIGLH